jgi:hypothetical protein
LRWLVQTNPPTERGRKSSGAKVVRKVPIGLRRLEARSKKA